MEQLLVHLVEMMVVMDQMVVILVFKLHLHLFIEQEEVVEVEQLIIPLILMEDLVVVVEEHLHNQEHQVEDKDKLPIIQVNPLIMEILVHLIKILVQELLVVVVGHHLVVEDVVKQGSVLQILDLMEATNV